MTTLNFATTPPNEAKTQIPFLPFHGELVGVKDLCTRKRTDVSVTQVSMSVATLSLNFPPTSEAGTEPRFSAKIVRAGAYLKADFTEQAAESLANCEGQTTTRALDEILLAAKQFDSVWIH